MVLSWVRTDSSGVLRLERPGSTWQAVKVLEILRGQVPVKMGRVVLFGVSSFSYGSNFECVLVEGQFLQYVLSTFSHLIFFSRHSRFLVGLQHMYHKMRDWD